jgi:hypothetical protein
MRKIIIGFLALTAISAFAGIDVNSLHHEHKAMLLKNGSLKNIVEANGVQQIKDFLGTVICPTTFPARTNSLQPIFQKAGRVFILFGNNHTAREVELMTFAGINSEVLGSDSKGFDYKKCVDITKDLPSDNLITATNAIRFVTVPSPYETFGADLKKLNPEESYMCEYKVQKLITGNLTPESCLKDSELPKSFDLADMTWTTEALGIIWLR